VRPACIDFDAASSTLAGGGKSGSPIDNMIIDSPEFALRKPSACTAHLAAPNPARRSEIGANFMTINLRFQSDQKILPEIAKQWWSWGESNPRPSAVERP
jgi:hypothetical protein